MTTIVVAEQQHLGFDCVHIVCSFSVQEDSSVFPGQYLFISCPFVHKCYLSVFDSASA